MFHFLPIAVRYDGSAPASDHGYQVHIGPMYSDARGTVKIMSTDPAVHPGAAVQLPVHRAGPPRVGRGDPRRARHPAPARVRPVQRRRAVAGARRCTTDEEILDWVARDGETALHPSCTCRMGVDDLSVIDPLTMRVHGLEGLRVVDASVMPYVTNGNIYAPVMMLAEKAADLILGNTPLPPETVDFYRHRGLTGGASAEPQQQQSAPPRGRSPRTGSAPAARAGSGTTAPRRSTGTRRWRPARC